MHRLGRVWQRAPGLGMVPSSSEHRNRSPSLERGCPIPQPHSPGVGHRSAPRTVPASRPRGQPSHGSRQALPAQPGSQGSRFAGCALQEGAESSYFLPKCQLPAQGSQPQAAGSFLCHCCVHGAHRASGAGTPSALSPTRLAGAGARQSLWPQKVSGAEPRRRDGTPGTDAGAQRGGRRDGLTCSSDSAATPASTQHCLHWEHRGAGE